MLQKYIHKTGDFVMAKTIKFNLICDDHSVRTLDDLREHFSIEDVLSYYKNGLLQRWLQVRGYAAELAAVNKIQAKDEIGVAREMAKIFGLEDLADDMEKDLYALRQYMEGKSASAREYIKQSESMESTVNSYFEGYDKLIQTICENKDNMPFIKAAVKEINDKYRNIFERNYKMLFISLYKEAPLAVFVMLTFDAMRNKFLQSGELEINDLLKKSCSNEETLKKLLGNNLKKFSGNTHNQWKNLEPSGKKYMLLNISDVDMVCPSGRRDKILWAEYVNGKFPILDGVDYRCNNVTTHKLLYMEV